MSEKPCIVDIGYIIGGDEGHLLVEMLLRMFVAWAEQQGLDLEILDKSPAFGGGLNSAKFSLASADRESFAALHHGAHTMVRIPPDSFEQRRHMSCAGVRVGDDPDAPLPETMADWGNERRRYFYDPYRAVSDTKLGRLEIDPDVLFAGDLSALNIE
ncbi:PCRF domain-containing protein [Sphingorhabdus contaminans]|uniref:PCRF domain-containing protein n=1 Tax=Sphingorhabdus contaminans TaxID=1343899 RepID=UPI003D2D4927